MSTVTEINLSHKHCLDRCSVLYGESGTGKSFVIIELLYLLKPYVDQIIVISPTDRQNNTYSTGVVPMPCIHYTFSAKLLDDIWERQSALSSVYTRANRQHVIQSLFDKIPNTEYVKNIISHIRKKCATCEDEIRENKAADADAKIAEIKQECKNLIETTHKRYIADNKDILSRMKLSQDEQFSLKYIDLNPRMVIIFDDCTDLLKKYKSHSTMQKLFYQGRWAYITALLACHTDKALDPELKKNAYMSIFTAEKSAKSYFERPSNNFDKEEKQIALRSCKAAFSPTAKHQKLVWMRDGDRFHRFTASKHENFRFGSSAVWEYCDKIQADTNDFSSDNKFIQDFM